MSPTLLSPNRYDCSQTLPAELATWLRKYFADGTEFVWLSIEKSAHKVTLDDHEWVEKGLLIAAEMAEARLEQRFAEAYQGKQ